MKEVYDIEKGLNNLADGRVRNMLTQVSLHTRVCIIILLMMYRMSLLSMEVDQYAIQFTRRTDNYG